MNNYFLFHVICTLHIATLEFVVRNTKANKTSKRTKYSLFRFGQQYKTLFPSFFFLFFLQMFTTFNSFEMSWLFVDGVSTLFLLFSFIVNYFVISFLFFSSLHSNSLSLTHTHIHSNAISYNIPYTFGVLLKTKSKNVRKWFACTMFRI